jgi:NAD dependent epimerase/dehydratase
MELSGMKVVVTGADGFIGSHLTEALVAQGCDVTAFCYYNSFDSWGWLDTVPEQTKSAMRVVMGDVRDPNGVREALRGADVVFHLAALIGIPFSYVAPDSYVDTNVKGTLNVLQAARALETERVLVTSTSEVYGTAHTVPIDESHPLQGQSPYSATKIAADKLAESFHLSFGLPVTTVRPFNTYGPRQSARAVIPTIISQLMAGSGVLRLGSLAPTRDLTFVTDTVAGFIALAECDETVGRVVNLGTGTEVSIGDLADSLVRMIAPETRIEVEDARIRPSASEVGRLLADISLVRSLTGWEPAHTLEQGLAETVQWFSDPANRAGYKPGYVI